MTSHNEIFGAFVEAQRALEELPQARQSISDLQTQLATCNDRGNQLEATNEGLRSQIDALNAKLTEVQNESDAISFRELETSDRLENLLRKLRGAMGTVEEAVTKADPRPEPEPVAAAPVSSTQEGGHSEPKLQSEIGLRDISAETAYDASWQNKGPTAPGAPTSPYAALGSQSEANPTASSATEQSPPVSSPEPASHVASPAAASSETDSYSDDRLPPQMANYSGRGYWEKPDSISWDDWTAGGGEKPHWIR